MKRCHSGFGLENTQHFIQEIIVGELLCSSSHNIIKLKIIVREQAK